MGWKMLYNNNNIKVNLLTWIDRETDGISES